jgi:translation initiation factor IF-3
MDRGRGGPPRPQHRLNHMIRVPEVRVIDENNEQLGVMSADQARALARERGFDLVEISPTAVPPVCRIMDYGRFKYEQKKRQSESRRKQHTMEIKELRVRPQTEEHDIETKLRQARMWLEDGDKVSVMMQFRGRQVVHSELGIQLMHRIAQDLSAVAKVERPPRLDGKRMTMVLSPLPRRA